MKHTRKLLCLLLALVLMFGLLPLHAHAAPPASLNPCDDGEAHDWYIYTPDSATCTEGGRIHWVCQKCGRDYFESTSALGHNWGEWMALQGATPQTCTEAGLQVRYCNRCQEMERREAPALGHSWNGGMVTKEATCTDAGVMTYTCTRCGETKTEAIPALGHNYVMNVTRQPTCTESGFYTETCSRCGDQRTAVIDPLGHDWEETVTEPHGLTDGERVRTCLRCYETETEVIPAVPGMFNLLRNVPPTAAEAGDMVVTQQPEGGQIPAGGSLTLTTAVEGGVAPYTYEWHREEDFVVTDGLLQAKVDQFTAAYNENKSGFAAAFQNALQQSSIGASLAEGRGTAIYMGSTFSYGSTAYNMGLEPVKLDLNDHSLGESESPDYPATAPGSYYCVIRDSAGHWVSTENAELSYGLRIVTQPQNANVHDQESVELRCEAAGGTPFSDDAPYTYLWHSEDGTSLGIRESVAEIREPGRYYCLVEDSTGATVTSATALVYDVEWLTVKAAQNVYFVDDPENVHMEIKFTITGGVTPYRVEFARNSDTLETFDINPGKMFEGSVTDTRTVTDTGAYFYMVTDAMGNFQIGTAAVDLEPLKITSQPHGGILSGYHYAFLSVSVEGGTKPYFYTLYRCGEEWHYESDPYDHYSFGVDTPGEYYFHIEDSVGRWADSDRVIVYKDDRPVITREPESVELEYREDGQYNFNLRCEAVSPLTGDDSNLSYTWYDIKGYYVAEGKNISFDRPGLYHCFVTDNSGNYTKSKEVTVAPPLEITNVNFEDRVLYCGIRGGVAPYRVEVYLVYEYGDKIKSVYCDDFRLDKETEQAEKFIGRYNGDASLQIVVRDDTGQKSSTIFNFN